MPGQIAFTFLPILTNFMQIFLYGIKGSLHCFVECEYENVFNLNFSIWKRQNVFFVSLEVLRKHMVLLVVVVYQSRTLLLALDLGEH